MEAFLYIGSAQSVFAAFLMLSKRNRSFADNVLGAWLVIISLQLITNLLALKYPRFVIPELIMLKTLPFTYGPFLYIYTKSLISDNPVFHPRFRLHFIPFAVFSFYVLLFSSEESIINEIRRNFLEGKLSAIHIIYSISIFASISIYVFRVFILVRKYKEKAFDHFSSDSEEINLRWLKTISLIFALAYFGAATARFYNIYFEQKDLFIHPELFPSIGLILFSYAIGFFGFNQSAIFAKKGVRVWELELTEYKPVEIKKEKYERSGLKKEDEERYLQQIMRYLEIEKPYLDGDFSIEHMSKYLKIPKHHLTQTINECLNKNFYTIVNEFRVEEVKRLMFDEKYKNLTIIAVAYDSGFNSKASFNTIFKKSTGLTPSEYRKKVINSTKN
jgi:AraC-like DNA-binding protein